MYCQQCGAELPEDARFCTECGYQLQKEESGKAAEGEVENEVHSEVESKNVDAPAQERNSDSGHEEVSSVSLSYGGFWKRLGALLIDSIIFGIVISIFQLMFVPAGPGTGMAASPEDMMAFFGFSLIVPPLLGWLYYAGFESSSWQGTPGKRALGLKVVDTQGEKVSFLRATGRHFSKIISSLILGIGFLMAAFTERKQALHDMIAGALVVEDFSASSVSEAVRSDESERANNEEQGKKLEKSEVAVAGYPAVETAIYSVLAVLFSLIISDFPIAGYIVILAVLYLSVIRVGIMPGIIMGILLPVSRYLQEFGLTFNFTNLGYNFMIDGIPVIILAVVFYLMRDKVNMIVNIIIVSLLYSVLGYLSFGMYIKRYHGIGMQFVFGDFMKYYLIPPLAGGFFAFLIYKGLMKHVTSE